MRISDWSSDVCSSDLNQPSMVFSPRWRRREPGMSYSRWANSRTICCNSPRARRSRLTRGPSTDRRNKALGSIAFMGTHLVDERSEEHTSELQSLMRISYAVFCLKKKKKHTRKPKH